MAGDWLKVEKDTPDKPEILALAGLLNLHPDEAFGKCFRFWRWADSQLVDGNARCVTKNALDALVGCAGFADALIDVGWLRDRNNSLQLPNFDRHMSESAKQRALTAKRVLNHKQRKGNARVTGDALPREEKRRDKKTPTPLPPNNWLPPVQLNTDEFRLAWERWEGYRRQLKKPLTDHSREQQLVRLAKLGEQQAIALIDNTIANSWQGLRDSRGSLEDILKAIEQTGDANGSQYPLLATVDGRRVAR